jgi:hypothetical protein
MVFFFFSFSLLLRSPHQYQPTNYQPLSYVCLTFNHDKMDGPQKTACKASTMVSCGKGSTLHALPSLPLPSLFFPHFHPGFPFFLLQILRTLVSLISHSVQNRLYGQRQTYGTYRIYTILLSFVSVFSLPCPAFPSLSTKKK